MNLGPKFTKFARNQCTNLWAYMVLESSCETEMKLQTIVHMSSNMKILSNHNPWHKQEIKRFGMWIHLWAHMSYHNWQCESTRELTCPNQACVESEVVGLKEEANCDMGRVNPHQKWVHMRVLMHDATPTWYTKTKLGGRSLRHFDCINDNFLNTILSQIWYFLSVETKNATKLKNGYDIKSTGDQQWVPRSGAF